MKPIPLVAILMTVPVLFGQMIPGQPLPAAFPGAYSYLPMGVPMMPQMGPEVTVMLVQQDAPRPIPTERLQAVRTTVNPSKLAPLISAGMQDFSNTMSTRPGLATLVSGVGALGGLATRSSGGSTSTYLWGLPAGSSSNSVSVSQPKFEVLFAGLPGVNPDEFEPRIVKMNPTKDNWRLLGITKMKETLSQGPAPAWPSYSNFLEETVPSQKTIVSPGDVVIAPERPLGAGQYAVVLRPVFKDRKYSAESITKNQGEGALFNSAWSFKIAPGSSDSKIYANVDSVEYTLDPASSEPPALALMSARNKVLAAAGASSWASAIDATGVTTYTSPDGQAKIRFQTTGAALLVDRFERVPDKGL